MRRIGSYEEYVFVSKGIRFINNGYPFDQIKDYIQRGCLYFDETSSRRIFIFMEDKFSQVVISRVLDAKEDTSVPECFYGQPPKPMVCYLMDDNSEKELLENWGFKYVCTSEKYILELVDLSILLGSIPADKLPDQLHFCFQTKTQEEIDQIRALWEDNLPLVEVSTLSNERFKQLEEKEQLFYIKNVESNQIIAAFYYDSLLSTSTIHHIVVHENYRKKHLARYLLMVWLVKLKEMKLRKAVCWIEEENKGSRITFEKFGFTKSNVKSYQYIL